MHEHQRFDRDRHIQFLMHNINTQHCLWEDDVYSIEDESNTNLSTLTAYDIRSCMHYWCCACTNNEHVFKFGNPDYVPDDELTDGDRQSPTTSASSVNALYDVILIRKCLLQLYN